ncbi:Rrf2 family transcriptional regulator, partial [Noviherbaspirillum denitrificans]|uniref:Rrf2 family transcriptional regulator n=1 Tax=Noviherbaspirillum denitrificans TaxID=1968433 RepID=UPI00197D183D
SCILAELLRQFPAAVGFDGLVRESDHSRDEVEAVCLRLYRNGLLRPDAGGEGFWRLAGDPARITLAELFSALLAPSENA